MNDVALALSDPLSPTFEKDAALFTAVRRRWCKAACHGSQTPLLDVCFNKDKSHLAKVYVYVARTCGSDGREEVLGLEAMRHVLQLLAVACKENSASTRSVTYSDNVTLLVYRSIVGAGEGLVVSALAC